MSSQTCFYPKHLLRLKRAAKTKFADNTAVISRNPLVSESRYEATKLVAQQRFDESEPGSRVIFKVFALKSNSSA